MGQRANGREGLRKMPEFPAGCCRCWCVEAGFHNLFPRAQACAARAGLSKTTVVEVWTLVLEKGLLSPLALGTWVRGSKAFHLYSSRLPHKDGNMKSEARVQGSISWAGLGSLVCWGPPHPKLFISGLDRTRD